MKRNLSLFAVLTLCAFCLVLAGGVAPADAAENLIPKMTSNTAPSGIASASSEQSGFQVYKAFDDNINILNGWASRGSTTPTEEWLAYEFPQDIIVNHYTITPYYSTTGGGVLGGVPIKWTFESWDGSNWVVLDQRENMSAGWMPYTKKEFSINNNTAYKKYRIFITARGSNYNTYTAIAELEMMYTGDTPTLNLSAAPSNTQITLTWNEIQDAISYNVQRATTPGGPYETIAAELTATSHTDTDVVNGTRYYYVVTAVTALGEGDSSNEASATPGDEEPAIRMLYVLLNIAEQVQLSVSHNLAANSTLTWTSDNEAVATVDDIGQVTAVSEGTAYIYAENDDGTFREYIPVRVVSGNADELRLAVHLNAGESTKLWLSDDTTGITWTSLNEDIATVSGTGVVTAVGQGLVIIQGEIDGEVYQIYVRVNA